MKKIVMVVILLTGCATSSNWQTVTGQTLGTIAQTVETAREGYIEYCNINNISASSQSFQQVQGIYGEYQLSFNTAESAYVDAVSSGSTNGFITALGALEGSESNLLQVISSFK